MSQISSYNQLPLALSASDIAPLLGVSKAQVYALMHANIIPTLRIGKRMTSPRDLFLEWMNQQVGKKI